MENWLKKLKKDALAYIGTLSDAELRVSLEKSGSQFYANVSDDFFDFEVVETVAFKTKGVMLFQESTDMLGIESISSALLATRTSVPTYTAGEGDVGSYRLAA